MVKNLAKLLQGSRERQLLLRVPVSSASPLPVFHAMLRRQSHSLWEASALDTFQYNAKIMSRETSE